MSVIACGLVTLMMMMEVAPAADCGLADNRCKAELFMRRAATAASGAVRAKYLEAAHGSFLALYDASGDVRDLCAARRTFDQTLAALGKETAPQRLVPLQEALERREQTRRPRCAAGPRKAAKAPVLAGARRPVEPSPPPAELLPASPATPGHADGLMPVASGRRAPADKVRSRETPVSGAAAAPQVATRSLVPVLRDSRHVDRGLVIAGSVTAGLGLSLVGVAGYAGGERMEARRASLELLAAAQGHATLEQRARDLELRDRYRTMGYLALGTSLAGGAAVLVGTTLAVIGGRRLARVARKVAVGPVPGGLVIRARF